MQAIAVARALQLDPDLFIRYCTKAIAYHESHWIHRKMLLIGEYQKRLGRQNDDGRKVIIDASIEYPDDALQIVAKHKKDQYKAAKVKDSPQGTTGLSSAMKAVEIHDRGAQDRSPSKASGTGPLPREPSPKSEPDTAGPRISPQIRRHSQLEDFGGRTGGRASDQALQSFKPRTSPLRRPIESEEESNKDESEEEPSEAE